MAEDIHERARKRLDAIWSVQQAERALCLEDRRFYSIQGAQWDDEWGAQFENAPRMEVNKVHAAIVRIFSEYRNNRITVDFRPKDEEGDDETADTLDGLYRADEEESGAQEAYDMAFEEAVGGGFGAWRLRACYEDEGDPQNDYQRVRMEPIPDADQCVLFDLDAKRQDKSDARFAFVMVAMSKEAFEEEYPGKTPSDIKQAPASAFEWYRDDATYVAEYYEIEEKRQVKVTMRHPVIEDPKTLLDPDAEEIAELVAQGWTEAARRKIKRDRVHKYIISGQEVLSDEGLIAGAHIPIVPVYGKRWYVEGVERCAGHVRYFKDRQRIYNAMISSVAETAGLSQHSRPIFTPEQVAGHEQEWADGNVKRSPYQLINPTLDAEGNQLPAGPVGTVEPSRIGEATATLLQVANNDLLEMSGEGEQADEVPANTSAQAIELIHTRADAKTFIYLDNNMQAHRRSGQIWLSMASELYVEQGRKMQALDQTGGRKYVELGAAAIQNGGDQATINDFARARFDVAVDVGPSSTTRRDATVRSLVGMASAAQTDPELTNALISTALMNMDGEGIDDVQDWIRKRLVRAGIVKPTDEEKVELEAEAANAQPDPQQALIEGATAQANAEAEKARAGAIKTMADTELVKVKIEEIIAGMSREDRQQIIDAIQADADRLIDRLPNPLHAGSIQ